MKTALERFLEYVKFDTQSNDSSGEHPSTPGQMVFAKFLADEMRKLGVENVSVSESAYVFGALPSTPGMEKVPALGFIAHMDTSDAVSGKDVRPQVIEYKGGVLPLGNSGRSLDPAQFPLLEKMTGHTLVTTDGTTLLGADDKAGIAEILTVAEQLIESGRPHGRICLGFTPDEEIGEGTLFFDVKKFDADFAYTLDGGAVHEVEYQNFNAAQASFEIRGRSVHPGTAKGVLLNAQKIAIELDSMLPPGEVPECTEKFQGFFHLLRSEGTVGSAKAVYLLRDHDAAAFEKRRETVERITERLNAKYGAGTVTLTVKEQYRNMEEVLLRHPFLIDIAGQAIRDAGLEPKTVPIRGGTDGALLSFKGLPCPNLGTGGFNFHSECEYASVQQMETAVRIVLNIVEAFARLADH